MSRADIDRFVNDLKDNPDLLNDIQSGSAGLGSIVDVARNNGYDISLDEAKDYIREQSKSDLSDEQLDSIAGGKGGGGGWLVAAAVEAAAAVTSAVQTAEVVTTVAEAADVATSVEVVAEAAAAVVAT